MNINNKVLSSTKWATITEIMSKFITPISNMILARILAPEAFGVVATTTMIISFSDMFTDAGFQKYLVQHGFKSDDEKHRYADVAFWTNLLISIVFWLIITIYKDSIALIVGNPGLGNVISIACIQLIFTSFSSIQLSLYRRDFDFKTIFFVRVITICVPFVITIPLALLGFSYWSLIIGSIVTQLMNAIIMTIKSKWRPKLFYRIEILKEMLSFGIWSLVEAIAMWFTVWIDSFIVGMFLNEYYLGLYKTSISLVNSIMSIVTASIIPVLFATLSRLQDNDKEFKAMFYKFQKIVAYCIMPIGIGVFIYRDLATTILLGDKWKEASSIIGIWSITSIIVIIFSYFNSEVYRAKGKPKISFISQVIHLIFLVPTCLVSLKYGFWVFIYARSLIRLQGVIVGLIIMSRVMKFTIRDTIKNTIKPILYSLIMGCVALFLNQISSSFLWSILSIIICISVYLIMVLMYSRNDLDFLLTNIEYTTKIKLKNKMKDIG